MKHLQTQTEWEIQMSEKILNLVHSELYLDLRYLELAFSALKPKSDKSLQALATDGVFLYYSPEQIIRVFPDNPIFLNRSMLHSVLHCIFRHPWLRGTKDTYLWGIACDIVAEYTIDHLQIPSTKRILTWERQKMYERISSWKDGISASVVYFDLLDKPPEKLMQLEREFFTDDHRFWPSSEPKQSAFWPVAQHWNQIARQMSLKQLQSGQHSQDAENLFSSIQKARQSRRSYQDFLKKFSMLREETHLDPDEFDLNYYTYGLRLYGNMPLLEPIESKESKKIQEFVIVIDTSDSTSGKLVESFLEETFDILSHQEAFFRKCTLRILQCDQAVRSEQILTSLEEAENLLKHFELIGGGGTDFRPAFTYVDDLLSSGKIKKLNGLLYFTDGKGVYPKKKPAYPSAFLFLNEYDSEQVPKWAIRLKLQPEEFLINQKKRKKEHYEYQRS